MAAKVRIKNDIILFFDLYTGDDQQPEDLSDIVNLSVQLKADVFGHVIIPIFSVTGNRIRIDVPAELQSVRGMYTLIVSYNRPNPEGTPPLNTFTIDQPAFELVARSIEAEPGAEGEPTVQTIQLNGVIGVAGPVGPIGPKGETGDDAYEVWAMQPGNEGKTIEDYFIFLQNPAYEAGITAVGAAQIALGAKQASEEAQAGSVAAMEKSDDFSNEAEDVEVEEGKFSSKHFSIKSGKSANLSQKWANEAEDVPVEGGEYSAKHYSLKAAAEKQAAVSAKEAAELAKTGSEAARDTAINTVNDVRETGEKNSVAIATLENVINSANINQETTATVTGVDTVALPKAAANTGMQVQLFGQSAQNLVVNGDFRNGTTGWQSVSSTSSISSGILTNTGNGQSTSAIFQTGVILFPIAPDTKIYFKSRLRVTNAVCTRISASSKYNNSANPATISNDWFINNPVQNQWYEITNIFQYKTTDTSWNEQAIKAFISHVYADAATQNGKCLEIDYAHAINLTATFGSGFEPDKATCDALFANYFEGVDNVLGTGRIRSIGKNILNLNTYGKRIFTGQNDGMTTGQRLLYYDFYAGVTRNGVLAAFNVDSLLINESELKFKSYASGYGFGVKFKAKAGDVFTRRETLTVGSGGQSGFGFYDSNGAILSHTTNVTETAPANTAFAILVLAPNTINAVVTYTNIQLERGNVVTAFEPFRQSSLYLTTPELRSNALIKDEIRKGANGYELVKRVGVGTLGSEIVTNGNNEAALFNFTGTRVAITQSIEQVKAGTYSAKVAINGDTVSTKYIESPILVVGKAYLIDFWYYIPSTITSPSLTVQDTSANTIATLSTTNAWTRFKILWVATSNRLRIRFSNANSGAVGQAVYYDDASIKELVTTDVVTTGSAFAEFGSNVNYTLATPEITPIAHAGLLNSNSNGTAYFEPIIADAGVYGSNIAIQLTDYPISSLERIVKRVNGADVELSTATAVIAGNGLSFTHPNLANGDLVMFTYAYNKESIGRSMTLTHYDSRFVEADTANGKVYRWGVTITNGVPTLTVQEV